MLRLCGPFSLPTYPLIASHWYLSLGCVMWHHFTIMFGFNGARAYLLSHLTILLKHIQGSVQYSLGAHSTTVFCTREAFQATI